MGKTRGTARRGRGRGRGKKIEQEMGFSSGDENAFTPPPPPKEHALPTQLLRGSSSHDDEEMNDLQAIEDALCCVTEAERLREEQGDKVSSPLNETFKNSTSSDSSKSVHVLSMIGCSNRSGDMQLSVPVDMSEDLMAAAITRNVKQKRGPIYSTTFNLTEIAMNDDEDGVESSFGPALVNVKGYHVRPEIAPILHQILEEQGDITKDCKLAKVLQGCLLEKVCHVHEKLHNTPFKEIQRNELTDMEETVSGLENAGFNLQWLGNKLDDFIEVKLFLNAFAKKKKELKKASDQLDTLRKTTAPIEQKHSDLEEEIKEMKNRSTMQKVRKLCCNPQV